MAGLEVVADLEEASRKAAELFASAAKETVAHGKTFSAVCSGGETPKRFYEILATDPFGPTLPWKEIHLFWADERCVPPEDTRSNYKMAFDRLISKIQIPANNVHRMKGESDPQTAAREYEQELRAFFRAQAFPKFNFVLLGLGANGHTASLFPHAEVLHETRKWVAATFVDEMKLWRLTLTAPAINHADLILFLVSGKEKAGVLSDCIRGPKRPEDLPAQLIRPAGGRLLWLIDRPAASRL